MNRFIIPGLFAVISLLFSSCGTRDCVPLDEFYKYDRKLPLKDTITSVDTFENYTMRHISYYSIHNKKVEALLSVPKSDKPAPVIILLHGVGDKKTVDYIEYGHKFFTDRGYAVFRIDIYGHGVRKEDDYDFDFTDGLKYWTRDIMVQTVLDLQRGVDLLYKSKGIDTTKIGFYGISLGGFIGTIFCSVDKRVNVPVLALTGGGMNIMLGMEALTDETLNYFSIIDPLNFVEGISPRPLLMLNAEDDEIVPPLMTKRLYNKAKEPKKIIWYKGAKHHTIPIDKVYQAGYEWYEKYF